MIDLYPWYALFTSIVITVMFGVYTVESGRARRFFHDDRSAIELLVSLALFLCSIGLLVSASAAFMQFTDAHMRQEIRNMGLGLVRGALTVLGIVLTYIAFKDPSSFHPRLREADRQHG